MALENKLHITDSAEIARMEEKISKKKAVMYLQAALENIEKHLVVQTPFTDYR